jgi:hypothetical protein
VISTSNVKPPPGQVGGLEGLRLDSPGSTRPGVGLNLRLDEVVIDCSDPCVLANFWSEALGYELTECEDDIASIEDPGGPGPSIFFQRVPEAKSVKNRVHFDLNVGGGDLELAVAQLVSLGARRVDDGGTIDRWWVVLADPEGNEFCVVG